MNTKLNHIQDWTELAKQANWKAKRMSEICGVSVRSLHRHFFKLTGKNTKTWLAEQRQSKASELLHNGSSIKEAASRLGYTQPTNFTRKYKDHWGVCPSQKIPIVSTQRPNVRK